MKKLYIISALLSITFLMSFSTTTTSNNNSKKNCGILKNSTFTYKNGEKDVLVVFKGNKYVGYHNDKEHFIKADIEWVTDCEYYLILKESTLPSFPFKKGTKMHIIVNRVSGKKVYYTSTLRGKSWKGKFTKIKNTKPKV